ncbi:MAG: 2,3-bisphosphoglycerate-independent phosphoglycerate mutase [Vampirovibrionales bacterium]
MPTVLPQDASLPPSSVAPHHPVCLVILDGWGHRTQSQGNAIAQAHTPTWDALLQRYPFTTLAAAGRAVGLPEGQVSNSEIGHRLLGTGQPFTHPRLLMDDYIAKQTLAEHPTWQHLKQHLQHHQSTLHLVGLMSNGGVHSLLTHFAELLGQATDEGFTKLRIHAITDGRDTPPYQAHAILEDIEQTLYDLGLPQIATVHGRFYAMDRDNRWERTQASLAAILEGKGVRQLLSTQAVRAIYAEDRSEEFIPPSITDFDYTGVEAGDALLCFNFRPDRIHQLMTGLHPSTAHADLGLTLSPQLWVGCLVEAGPLPESNVFFKQAPATETLGGWVAAQGWSQFRCAETEKYAHVTYFFNGGQEAPYPNEHRCLIPSPTHVTTYDEVPRMSLDALLNTAVERLTHHADALTVINLANPDMIGHTGNLAATIEAVEAVDAAVATLLSTCERQGITLMITADHGNADTMLTLDGTPNTAHSLAPVPFVLVAPTLEESQLWQASVQACRSVLDVAPLVKRVLQHQNSIKNDKV